MDKTGNYGAMNTTSRVGVSFGTRLPETFYEDFASILEACKIEEDEETSGGATSLHALVLMTTDSGLKNLICSDTRCWGRGCQCGSASNILDDEELV